MTDALGRDVNLFDYFTIPGRAGSSLWVTFGRVDGIEDGKIVARTMRPWAKEIGRKTWITRSDRMTIVRRADVPERFVQLFER